MIKNAEHTLEFLLDFNGRIHCYEKGYWVKFEITQGDKTAKAAWIELLAHSARP